MQRVTNRLPDRADSPGRMRCQSAGFEQVNRSRGQYLQFLFLALRRKQPCRPSGGEAPAVPVAQAVPHAGLGFADSPSPRARSALERADDVFCDPATIKIAHLRIHPLAIYKASVHLAGIKSEESRDFRKPSGGCPIAPSDVRHDAIRKPQRVIARGALPFAKGTVGSRAQKVHPNGSRREVIDGRMARFQDTKRFSCFGHGDLVDQDLKP